MDKTITVEIHEFRNRWLTGEYVAIAIGAIAFGVLVALILG